MQTELYFAKDIIKRKKENAGHMLSSSSGLSHLQILEDVTRKKKSRWTMKNMDEIHFGLKT